MAHSSAAAARRRRAARPCTLTDRPGERRTPRAPPDNRPARSPRPARPGPGRTGGGHRPRDTERALRDGPSGRPAHRRRPGARRARPPRDHPARPGPYPQRLGSAPRDRARALRLERAVRLGRPAPGTGRGGHRGRGQPPGRRRPDTRRGDVPAPRGADADPPAGPLPPAPPPTRTTRPRTTPPPATPRRAAPTPGAPTPAVPIPAAPIPGAPVPAVSVPGAPMPAVPDSGRHGVDRPDFDRPGGERSVGGPHGPRAAGRGLSAPTCPGPPGAAFGRGCAVRVRAGVRGPPPGGARRCICERGAWCASGRRCGSCVSGAGRVVQPAGRAPRGTCGDGGTG